MIKKAIAFVYFFAQLFTVSGVYAAKDNVLVSGTKALLNDALFWILILIPVSAAVFIGWQSWLKSGLDEPAEMAQKDKIIKRILVASVIGECGMAIVKLVLSYYGVTVTE
ncbi:hypothetical protein [Brevibacillus massiliensis]|uniref:hypothetical protein n=1 Tax=Brevibacillus massiliensis TaxID=1118054 RepID=UPI000303AEB1|nr:hypothetical protein [Brevibacillus massiliensis]